MPPGESRMGVTSPAGPFKGTREEEFLFQVKYRLPYELAIGKAGRQGCVPLDQPGLTPIAPEIICLP